MTHGFTGLYFEYQLWTWWIFVIRYRKGTYDYWNSKEEMCEVRSAYNIEKIFWTPKQAKQWVESQRIQSKEK